MRIFWIIIGSVSLLLGIVGIVLPLVPTTPFLLVSAFAFAESSPRLHQWLLNHPKLGPIIENWQKNGAIDRKSKMLALGLIVLSPFLSLLFNVPMWALASQVSVLTIVAIFILTRPDA